MAASEPASAGKKRFEQLSGRVFGLAVACAVLVSCTAVDNEHQLSLAEPSAGPVSQEGGTATAPLLAAGSVKPSSRPETAVAEDEPAARQAGAPLIAVAESNGTARQDSSLAAGQQAPASAGAAQPADASGTAEPEKRGLFAGLFAGAAKEPATGTAKAAQSADTASGPAAEPEAAAESAASARTETQPAPAAEPPVQVAAAQQPEETAAPPQPAAEELPAQKRSFLSAFFAPSETRVPFPDNAAEAEKKEAPVAAAAKPEPPKPAEPAKPIVALASTGASQAAMFSTDALPGVRPGDQLFEIRLGSGLSDDGDVDVYEQEEGYYQVAAAGLARLAPNGLLKQRESVDVSCFKPKLVQTLKTIERHFGKRVVVTSGYRSPDHNRRVRGARNSMHMHCAAADILVEGVNKFEVARFVRSLPGRGGVGTYCHTNSIHVDVGPERDWNWRCGRRG